ncbi:MAG: glycosyltransferase [Sphingomonadales bacterium]|nr:glycosyltransferase [Sphingomonadales bacterium]MDE2569957.1 glycosyltransferase [Sphingomonadales bacterium]
MSPWLTVIVPVHQGAELIGATLASAAQEVPEGVEFLFYNSGEDGGAARRVAEGFSDRLDLHWRDTPELKPWTAKITVGVREARADHVAMLHQDDLWLPGHLASVLKAIRDYPQAALSIAPSRFAAPDGQLLGEWRLPFLPGPIDSETFASTLVVQNTIAIPSPVIRRDAFLACGGIDEALWYTADWDLYLKLAQHGYVAVREAVTTAFRIHGGSLTMSGSRNATEFRRQQEIVLERHLPAIPPAPRSLERRARASIDVNCALAAASAGKAGGLAPAALALVRLGPRGMARYLFQSRLADRLAPRVKLRISGNM